MIHQRCRSTSARWAAACHMPLHSGPTVRRGIRQNVSMGPVVAGAAAAAVVEGMTVVQAAAVACRAHTSGHSPARPAGNGQSLCGRCSRALSSRPAHQRIRWPTHPRNPWLRGGGRWLGPFSPNWSPCSVYLKSLSTLPQRCAAFALRFTNCIARIPLLRRSAAFSFASLS